jgi:hypothetical protein
MTLDFSTSIAQSLAQSKETEAKVAPVFPLIAGDYGLITTLYQDHLIPEVKTRDELEAEFAKDPNLAPGPYANFVITFEIGHSCAASVVFKLWDIEDEDEAFFDMQVSIDNGDAVGPKYMCAALVACTEAFYALGLDTQFGQIVGD